MEVESCLARCFIHGVTIFHVLCHDFLAYRNADRFWYIKNDCRFYGFLFSITRYPGTYDYACFSYEIEVPKRFSISRERSFYVWPYFITVPKFFYDGFTSRQLLW